MRKVGNSLLIIFLFCLTFISVSAESSGIIKGIYSYDTHPFTNQPIYLYKIADIKDLDSDDKFVYLEPYSNFETNINTLNSSEWQKYANELKSYIETNNITYDTQVLTDMDGNYEFSELSNGLYLMLVDDVLENGATYTSLPTLISVPTYDETEKKYINEITVKSKIEEIKPEPTEPPDEPTPDVPQTSDNVMVYVVIFVFTIIILIGVGYY
ncbi:MAG: hypothetical protein K2I70_04480, partial [Bacilli bacterium]|nr:hypothetical protein [Bacilli bacterium]